MTQVAGRDDEVLAVIESTLREVGADLTELDRASALGELKIDSVDLLVLAQTLEERFGVAISARAVAELRTVGDAIDLVLEGG